MTPDRRHWLIGAAGLGSVALGAGLGLGWWRHRPTGEAPHPLFARQFEGPDGAPLPMARFLGGPLVVNFWATWCPPCLREMPVLDAFWRERRATGWHVVGLAVDRPEAVREFLRRHPVDFPIGVLGFDGVALARDLGNDTGGLPFSAGFDPDGRHRGRYLGELTAQALAAWVSDWQRHSRNGS